MIHKVRRKDKESSSSSTTTEALTAKRNGFQSSRGKGDIGEFTTDSYKLGKNQCAFCKKEGHWKIDYPRLKKEKGQKSDANFAQVDDGTDSDSSRFSLYITLTLCYSEESE